MNPAFIRLAVVAALVWSGNCMASLTHDEEHRVPRPVYEAYLAVLRSAIYVCPPRAHRDPSREAEMDRNLRVIRLLYAADFDDPDPDEEFFLPTHCPRREEYKDWDARMEAWRQAVHRLTDALRGDDAFRRAKAKERSRARVR